MGLLGCPASFQHLMGCVLRNISNVIAYIDDLLVHTQTHEEHLRVLEQVLEHLHTKQAQNQSGQMFFWQQRSFIPWIHPHS
jgi:hypothetical protein